MILFTFTQQYTFTVAFWGQELTAFALRSIDARVCAGTIEMSAQGLSGATRAVSAVRVAASSVASVIRKTSARAASAVRTKSRREEQDVLVPTVTHSLRQTGTVLGTEQGVLPPSAT